uniref:Uncharacterized protein n=1 Tax=Alexandrium monilatum TaxID=311494 RepID=A0A7S4RAQ4_9DINO
MPYVTVDEHLDEGARECGEESAAASSHRQSLALGGVAKIVVAFAASAGLAACALEWKGFLSRPSLRQSSTGAAVRLAEDQSFDCFDEIRDWRHAWSAPKKEYCCLQTHVGCRSDEPLETGTVGVLQLDEITKFPVQVQDTSYDCNDGYNNWRENWPKEKKDWCCSNYDMGCTEEEQRHASGWLFVGIAGLTLMCVGAILACVALVKRKRDEELRKRWASQYEQNKTRRCCTGGGWFSQSEDAPENSSWFSSGSSRQAESERSCC